MGLWGQFGHFVIIRLFKSKPMSKLSKYLLNIKKEKGNLSFRIFSVKPHLSERKE